MADTAFQSNAFQSDAFQEYAGVTAVSCDVDISILEDDDSLELTCELGYPRVEVDGGLPDGKKKKHPRKLIEELVDEVIRNREAPPPKPREEIKAFKENAKYQVIPIYKPSLTAIPLVVPPDNSEAEELEELSALVSLGML